MLFIQNSKPGYSEFKSKPIFNLFSRSSFNSSGSRIFTWSAMRISCCINSKFGRNWYSKSVQFSSLPIACEYLRSQQRCGRPDLCSDLHGLRLLHRQTPKEQHRQGSSRADFQETRGEYPEHSVQSINKR